MVQFEEVFRLLRDKAFVMPIEVAAARRKVAEDSQSQNDENRPFQAFQQAFSLHPSGLPGFSLP